MDQMDPISDLWHYTGILFHPVRFSVLLNHSFYLQFYSCHEAALGLHFPEKIEGQ